MLSIPNTHNIYVYLYILGTNIHKHKDHNVIWTVVLCGNNGVTLLLHLSLLPPFVSLHVAALHIKHKSIERNACSTSNKEYLFPMCVCDVEVHSDGSGTNALTALKSCCLWLKIASKLSPPS